MSGLAKLAASERGDLALAVFSGCLTASSVPPLEVPLGLVAYVPWVIALARTARRSERALAGAWRLGLAQGIAVNGLTLYWVYPALRTNADVPVALGVTALVAVIAWQAARSALISVLHVVALRRGMSAPLTFPAALVAVELVYPFLFPWNSAILLHQTPALTQLASVGGTYLVAFVVALVNAGIAGAWCARQRGSKAVALRALTPSLVLLLVWGHGALRRAELDRIEAGAQEVELGLVQANLAPARRETRDPGDVYRELTLDLLQRHSAPALVVWPETAISYPVRRERLRALVTNHLLRDRRQGASAAVIGVPLLAGMIFEDAEGLANVAALLAPSGELLSHYQKQALIPVGERAPLDDLIPQMRQWFPPITRFTAAEAPSAVHFDGHAIAISICYEDLLPALVRRSVQSIRPELLVNLTSDVWFGASPGSALHFAAAKLRAIEHARYLVRVTTTGVTAVVSPSGEVTALLPANQPASSVVAVRWLTAPTPYTSIGDALAWAAVALALAAARLVSLRRR